MITRPRTPHGKAQGIGGASIGEGSRAAPTGLVERYLPKAEADVAECHETLVDAPSELVFDIAEDLDLLSIPAVYAIFWLRALVVRAPRPDRDDLRGLVRQTKNMGWGELERRPARELVMGAAVQPWLSEPVFEPLPSGDFRTWAEPDHVKIVWTLESEALGPARTRFRTRTRVQPTDREARRRFRRYWRFAHIGIVLIRWLLVSAIRKESTHRPR